MTIGVKQLGRPRQLEDEVLPGSRIAASFWSPRVVTPMTDPRAP